MKSFLKSIFGQRRVFLDFASGAPMSEDVLKEISKAEKKFFGNPSSIHKEGVSASLVLDSSRTRLAKIFNASKSDAVFTSGSTESANLVIFGIVKEAIKSGITHPHILISPLEHSAVRESVYELQKNYGANVEEIECEMSGVVSLQNLRAKLKRETVLVSVSQVASTTGTIQPIREIKKSLRHFKKFDLGDHEATYPVLITDITQSVGRHDLVKDALSADVVFFGGNKVGGPKGVGALVFLEKLKVAPIIFGGGQEFGLRAGTENLSAILGFVKAIENSFYNKNEENNFVKLRNILVSGLKKLSAEIVGGDSLGNQSSHIVSFVLPPIESELLIIELDARGFAVSGGSACDVNIGEHSRILSSLGYTDDISVLGLVRVSFGKSTKEKDIENLLKAIQEIKNKYSKVL